MREHQRLGRVAGITVGLNWSVLAIFAIIVVGLAAGRFPALFPDVPTAGYVAAGIVAGVVFLASLLAHELSHALVARRHGVQVDGITLWLFGGVARMSGDPPDPAAELRISGVGPLVSLGLALVFSWVTWLADLVGLPGIVIDVFVWLALINVVLAIFNLLPAAPLDGGRILRALLWRRGGDRFAAAVTAARAGRGLGWALMGLGLAQLVIGQGAGGVWVMLVGWFLTTVARSEQEYARVSGALSDVPVREVMSEDPVAARASLPVGQFIDAYLSSHPHSAYPVTTDGEEAAGLVTLDRVRRVPVDDRSGTSVGEIACPLDEVAVVAPDEPLAEVIPRMNDCSEGRGLVVDDGRVVGIVSPTDLMRQLDKAGLSGGRDQQRI